MKVLKCPECESLLDIYIGTLRPWEAVAAEMLEKGVIYHCPSCHTRNFDDTDLTCPQCNEKSLRSKIKEGFDTEQITKNIEGIIYCEKCEFKFQVW